MCSFNNVTEGAGGGIRPKNKKVTEELTVSSLLGLSSETRLLPAIHQLGLQLAGTQQ